MNDSQIEDILSRIESYEFEAIELAEFNFDSKLVLKVVSKLGAALEYATQEQKDNKEIVLAAVTDLGNALEYASDRLKSDEEVVLAALKGFNFKCPFQFACETLRSSLKTVRKAVEIDARSLRFASDEIKLDKKLSITALTQHGELLEFLPEFIKSDKDCVLAAVKSDGLAIRFATKLFRADAQILETALKQNPFAENYDEIKQQKINSTNERTYLISIDGIGGEFEAETIDKKFADIFKKAKKGIEEYDFYKYESEYENSEKSTQFTLEGPNIERCSSSIYNDQGNFLAHFNIINNIDMFCLPEISNNRNTKTHYKVSLSSGTWRKFSLELEEQFDYSRLVTLTYNLDETFGDFKIFAHLIYIPKAVVKDSENLENFIEDNFLTNDRIYGIDTSIIQYRENELRIIGCIVAKEIEFEYLRHVSEIYHFFR